MHGMLQAVVKRKRDKHIVKGMDNLFVHGRYVQPCDFLPSLVDLMVHTKIHPKKEMIYKRSVVIYTQL